MVYVKLKRFLLLVYYNRFYSLHCLVSEQIMTFVVDQIYSENKQIQRVQTAKLNSLN